MVTKSICRARKDSAAPAVKDMDNPGCRTLGVFADVPEEKSGLYVFLSVFYLLCWVEHELTVLTLTRKFDSLSDTGRYGN